MRTVFLLNGVQHATGTTQEEIDALPRWVREMTDDELAQAFLRNGRIAANHLLSFDRLERDLIAAERKRRAEDP